MDEKVKLVSKEGEVIEVDKEVAIMSIVLKNEIEDFGSDGSIKLPDVRKEVIDKVIEFCKYIKENPDPEIEKPLRTTNMGDIVACGTLIL